MIAVALASLLATLPEVSVVVSRRIELSAASAAPVVASVRAAASARGLTTVRRDDLTACEGVSDCVIKAGAARDWAYVIHLDLASVGNRLLFRAELVATREGSAPLAAEVAAVTGPDRLGEPIDRFLSACISALTAIESRSPAEATQEPPSTPGSVTAPTDPEISPETTGRWPAWLSFGGAGVSAAAGLIFAGVRIDAGVRLDRAYQPEGDERRAALSFTEASSLASTGNVALVLSLVTLAVSVGLAVLGVVLLPSSDL